MNYPTTFKFRHLDDELFPAELLAVNGPQNNVEQQPNTNENIIDIKSVSIKDFSIDINY